MGLVALHNVIGAEAEIVMGLELGPFALHNVIRANRTFRATIQRGLRGSNTLWLLS